MCRAGALGAACRAPTGVVMVSVTATVVCLTALTTASGFIAPLAGRYDAPVARSGSKAALRMMSTENGDDKPLVFPR